MVAESLKKKDGRARPEDQVAAVAQAAEPIADVIAAHMVTATYQVSGVGPTVNGRNGEDDRYYTDGEIHIAVLSPDGRPVEAPPKAYESTPLIALKDGVWSSVSGWLGN